MSDLRTAAQQALEALEAMQSYAAAERKGLRICDEAIPALRAALAQQAEPLNLSDPAVQKRLATQWGYVPAAQAEPVEPVGWNWMLDGQPYGQAYYGNPPDTDIAERAAIAGRTVRLLYTAPPPPQRKPLTEEEIKTAFHAARNAKLGASQDNSRHRLSVIEIARAVEKAVWEKNHGQA